MQLYFVMESPSQEAVLLGRFHSPEKGEIYNCGRMTTPAGGKRQYLHASYPAATRSGKLRLTRRGALVACLVSESDPEEFRPIHEFELGTADLTFVRMAADTGNSNSSVEVRIGDLEIRSTDVPAELSRDSAHWRLVLLYLSLAIVGLLLGAGGLRVWSRRQAEENSARLKRQDANNTKTK